MKLEKVPILLRIHITYKYKRIYNTSIHIDMKRKRKIFSQILNYGTSQIPSNTTIRIYLVYIYDCIYVYSCVFHIYIRVRLCDGVLSNLLLTGIVSI